MFAMQGPTENELRAAAEERLARIRRKMEKLGVGRADRPMTDLVTAFGGLCTKVIPRLKLDKSSA